MAQEEGWERTLTRSAAVQVRRYRLQRKMSAQDLSDRCAEFGVPIPRPVLSNLENGRRESITLAELLVLAAALDVSPTLLIVPVAAEEKVEILPGRTVRSDDVLDWFTGDIRIIPTDTGFDLEDARPLFDQDPAAWIFLYRHHNSLVAILTAQMALGEYVPQDVGSIKEGYDGGPGELRLFRRVMRELGIRVPQLPSELAHIDPPHLPPEEFEEEKDRIRHAVRRG